MRPARGAEARRAILGGALYFGLVFTAAFAFGAIRVSVVTPVTGPFRATLIELPFTLGVAWFACGWIVRRAHIPAGWPALIMGLAAFIILMIAEALLAVLAFGRTPADYLAAFATAAGALGLAGQIGFAVLPLVRSRPSRAPSI